MIIRRVGPLSCAKIAAALYALFGLIIGAMFSLIAMANAGGSSDDYGNPFAGAIVGVGAIVFLPIAYGIFGFVATLISAALYNFLAGIVGGVEIDVA